MKNVKSKFKAAHGYALLMVLTVLSCAALIAASTSKRTYTVVAMNQRAKQYQSAMYAAEASVEKVFARIRYDYLNGGHAALSNNISIYRNMTPLSSENAHWTNYQFWNAQGANNQTYVNLISNRSYQVLDGNYSGLSGWRGVYRVVSNARSTAGMHPVSVGVQQDIAVDTIPAFQFAIFYNGQLEFTQCAPLEVRGRVHANGPICMGAASGNTLRFWNTITTTHSIVVSNMAGYSGFATPIYNGTPQNTVGVPTLNLPIGTNNTPAAVREIINMPPAGEPVNSSMGLERYYNKAAVVLLVSNTSITYIVKDKNTGSGTVSNITYNSAAPSTNEQANLSRWLPFVNLTNRFYDYRESRWVMPSQIDMGELKNWLPTNSTVLSRFPAGSGVWPNIMYVNDFRTVSSNLHAVRLANGSIIPTNGVSATNASGFTLATENPLYVWGNYNLPNSSHAGTTNTTATFPASLISDAITVLSPRWRDDTYGNNTNATYAGSAGLDNRIATNTTINAAIIAGAVYTTGSAVGQWSGGVHNLTRLLERWSGYTLTLNSSIVNLYNSAKATTQFINPGTYYRAPERRFSFDQNFLTSSKLPPGTPSVAVISRFRWTTVPTNTVTYYGP